MSDMPDTGASLPKEFEDDDPMQLVGMILPGEEGQLEAMAECIVEEYVRMGWDERRLMTVFTNPLFLATHRIYRLKGEGYVREMIDKTCAKWRPLVGGPPVSR